jgi:hypothetical protein
VSVELLTTSALAATITALFDSAAGEAGKSAWATLSAAAARLLGRTSSEATTIARVDEAAIAPQTHDLPAASAQAADILLALAHRDHDFAELLAAWHADPTVSIHDASTVTNTVSGQVNGPVIQLHTNHGGIRFDG